MNQNLLCGVKKEFVHGEDASIFEALKDENNLIEGADLKTQAKVKRHENVNKGNIILYTHCKC